MTWVLSFGILCATAVIITGMVLKHFNDDLIAEKAEDRVLRWSQDVRERLSTMERQVNTVVTEWREFKEGK